MLFQWIEEPDFRYTLLTQPKIGNRAWCHHCHSFSEDFLAKRGSPLPYSKISNVIGTLNEHLQKVGETPAEIIVTSHSQTRSEIFCTVNWIARLKPVISVVRKLELDLGSFSSQRINYLGMVVDNLSVLIICRIEINCFDWHLAT